MTPLIALASLHAHASCYTFVSPPGEPVTNADSSLIVTFDAEQTFLTMAADARGESATFGYLLPVPPDFTVEDAELVDPGIYEGLHAFAAPRLVETSCAEGGATNGIVASGCGGAPGFAAAPDLDGLEAEDTLVAEHRTLGAYDLTVLEPSGAGELSAWLDDNGFVLAPAAEPVVEDLVEQGVWFLAVHVDGSAGEGWVEPLRLRYEGHMNSVPLLLGATSSDGVQDLVVLVVDGTGASVRIANYPEAEVEDGCMIDGDLDATYDRLADEALLDGERGAWASEAVIRSVHEWAEEGDLDTSWLAAVGSTADPMNVALTRLHLRYTPAQIDEDLVLLRDEGREDHRTTYVAYARELETLYPICGEGFVTGDPGSCPEATAAAGGVSASSCSAVPVGMPWAALALLGALARRRQGSSEAPGSWSSRRLRDARQGRDILEGVACVG